MKCIPITLSALEVFAAILVIDMEEVLVDKIHSLGLCKSISLNIESFISKFSVAASITNSAFYPRLKEVSSIMCHPAKT